MTPNSLPISRLRRLAEEHPAEERRPRQRGDLEHAERLRLRGRVDPHRPIPISRLRFQARADVEHALLRGLRFS